MKRKYYVLFNCDEYKAYSSMKLIGVFTEKELRRVIRKKIKEKEFEFYGNITEILNEKDLKYIFDTLEYGYFQEISINGVL